MTFDKAIINPNDDVQLAKQLTKALDIYRKENKVIEKRDYCTSMSIEFSTWLDKNYPDLTNEVLDTKFYVDSPVNLPLDMDDLMRKERIVFNKEYSTEYLKSLTKMQKSKLIYDFIVKYHGYRPADLYNYHHVVVLVNDIMIVDLTKKQFEKAVQGPITLDRYDF